MFGGFNYIISSMLRVKNVLISVFNKEGIVEFARDLESLGLNLFATGGTADILRKVGVRVKPLSEITGFPEILGGKVKTLHPDIFARILATHEEAEVARIMRFEMLVVNLYSPDMEPDIGGVSLIRAGIKAGDRTVVVFDRRDYDRVVWNIKNFGGIPHPLLEELNRKAARYVLEYQLRNYREHFRWDFIPIVLEVAHELRYGTNPTRRGFLLSDGTSSSVEFLKGDISLNNLYDADSSARCAFALKRILNTDSACIVKHGSPCGVASSDDPEALIELAWESDPKSAYGGIIAVTFPISAQIAERMKGKFFEVIVSPAFDEEAIRILSSKRARLIRVEESFLSKKIVEIRGVLGGYTYEEYKDDDEDIRESDFRPTYEFEFSAEDIRELMFSYTVARFGKSNCVAITSGFQLWGIGVGMTARVDAAEFAVRKLRDLVSSCGKTARRFYVSSDGFFPFPDSLRVISDGIKGVFPDAEIFVAHPGGSIRDSEVVKTARELGVKLFVTGKRCFRH